MSTTTLPKGVKTTSGGKFDRDAPLTYFIAGAVDSLLASPHPHLLIAVNELTTAQDFARLDELCDQRDVMLDSGIFNLANTHARRHGVTHDQGLSMAPEEIDGFSELWDRYGEVTTRYKDRLWGVVELDQGGVEHKPRVRARIEAEFGVTPMPVYHPLLDGWDYYDDLARNYDRLCVGNIVKASAPLRLRLVHTAAERAREYPYLWQHFLGMTPNENLLAIPYRGSCDSSAWLAGLRWMATAYKGWGALKMISLYPAPMWYDKDQPGSYDKAAAILGITALAIQQTIVAMQEDSHPWL